MNEKLMQKMFIIFESIIKSEGATDLTNERIKKCCEENCVDYEEFIASVLEEVWSVIGSHSENTGDVLLSELSSKNLEEVSGGAGFFQRDTASALAALSLCGATQLPASAVKEKDHQVLLQERVASRHLKKRSVADSVIKSQTAQNIAKYLFPTALGPLLIWLCMRNRSGGAENPASFEDLILKFEKQTCRQEVLVPANGFWPENAVSSARAWFKNGSSIVTPYLSKKDGQLFRIEAFFNTLAYCKNTLGFSVQRTCKTGYTANDMWVLPEEYQEKPPVVINEEVTSVSVTTPFDSSKCAKIWISNGRSLQTMVAVKHRLGESFDTKKTALLDFANFFDPGGAPFSGCFAQEESLCRITNLYPLLCNKPVKDEFYGPHKGLKRKTKRKDLAYWESIGTFRDCIYVPNVQQIKNDYGASRIDGFINGPIFNVIAAAAPDLRKSEGLVNTGSKEYRECFKKLWRQIIGTAYKKENKNLIAGALGCGAFKNNPKVAAETFFDVLMNEGPAEGEYKGRRWAEMIDNVVLSNYIHRMKESDVDNYNCFLSEAMKYANKGLNVECYDLECPE